jgi:hypothetical protein
MSAQVASKTSCREKPSTSWSSLARREGVAHQLVEQRGGLVFECGHRRSLTVAPRERELNPGDV